MSLSLVFTCLALHVFPFRIEFKCGTRRIGHRLTLNAAKMGPISFPVLVARNFFGYLWIWLDIEVFLVGNRKLSRGGTSIMIWFLGWLAAATWGLCNVCLCGPHVTYTPRMFQASAKWNQTLSIRNVGRWGFACSSNFPICCMQFTIWENRSHLGTLFHIVYRWTALNNNMFIIGDCGTGFFESTPPSQL